MRVLIEPEKYLSRSFNKITPLYKEGLVHKYALTVEAAKKLEAEVNWYIALPQTLKMYTPHLHSTEHNGDGKLYGYKLELIPYSNLYQHVAGTAMLDSMPSNPNGIFSEELSYALDTISTMLAAFRNDSKFLTISKELSIRDAIKMYRDKFQDRSMVVAGNDLRALCSISINDNYMAGLARPSMKDFVDHMIDYLITTAHDNFSYIHGDLFFGNMLYDAVVGHLKLVDPRGSFGSHSIFPLQGSVTGDQRYDYGKLTHSFLGQYDCVVHGNIKLSSLVFHDHNILTLKYSQDVVSTSLEAFETQYLFWLEDQGMELDVSCFLAAMMFLTMLPLHTDSIDRQYLLYGRGIELLNRAYNLAC